MQRITTAQVSAAASALNALPAKSAKSTTARYTTAQVDAAAAALNALPAKSAKSTTRGPRYTAAQVDAAAAALNSLPAKSAKSTWVPGPAAQLQRKLDLAHRASVKIAKVRAAGKSAKPAASQSVEWLESVTAEFFRPADLKDAEQLLDSLEILYSLSALTGMEATAA
jgi:hypothetical protein